MSAGFVTGTTPLTVGQWYHVWVYLAKGTGSNAQGWLKLSTSATMPGTNEITVSNGAWTNDRIAVYPSTQNNSGSEIIYDQFVVATTVEELPNEVAPASGVSIFGIPMTTIFGITPVGVFGL
jgi:hypothetical protein